MDILQEIVAHKHLELEQLCAKKTSLREALLQSETGIIAELSVSHLRRDGSKKRDAQTSFHCRISRMVPQR